MRKMQQSAKCAHSAYLRFSDMPNNNIEWADIISEMFIPANLVVSTEETNPTEH